MITIETGIEDGTTIDKDMVREVLVTTTETGIITVIKAEMIEEMSIFGMAVEAEGTETTIDT